MAATSNMLPLGTLLPAFSLTNAIDEQLVRTDDLSGKPVLVMIICNHCRFL
jgi:peroxiredoxin